ncbi:MAG: HAMP domain-containing histidine kinase [Bacteroidales bacterium]|nr:HAMP domain-containing histidine kinase [Bacteroidales bacterium]MCF8455764.1 HAMP domain-containing histidine kinase [Bacteroidales bacterium]
MMAVLIGMSSLVFTNRLVTKLSKEERKSVELWAEANRQLSKPGNDQDISFIFEVIRKNKTIPVIMVDEEMTILAARNLDSLKSIIDKKALGPEVLERNLAYLYKQLEIMKSEHEPIEIVLMNGHKNIIYYKDSILLTQLFYYPFFQLGVIFLFILVAYLAFSSSRRAEQNQVWVGMSKETAHQLGTPISSLLAWVEYMKEENTNQEMLLEVEKDVQRLETITERFSKIGSAPVLVRTNIVEVINSSIAYLKTRTSKKVNYQVNYDHIDEILVPINQALFEWVIENLCKNAIDAMEGAGEIEISIQDNTQIVYVDIKDTGKGIPKTKFKTVFQPGYTTKQRGWGLGLSLSERIIETYHAGKIFVKSSDHETGTTFRIALRK